MRLISILERDTSCRELFNTLNILPVPCMYILETVYYMKLNINGIEQDSVRHDYNTRHRSDLQSQFCRNGIFEKSVNLENMQLFRRNYNPFYCNKPSIP
jgi:hypothetical protein